MATEKLSMRKFREILKLKYEQDFTNRTIGKSIGISASTVSTYLSRAKLAGVTWPLPPDLDDNKLSNLSSTNFVNKK